MPRKRILSCFLILLLLAGFLRPLGVHANSPQVNNAQSGGVTAFDLILAMNTLRVSFGLPALIEDPIINAVAQSTAETMAANNMSWHIGNVSGRIQAAGYGGGAKVWATENFAVGTGMGIDQIMVVWADAEHMRPATVAAYCHVGAGVAQAANGRIYYILQAAYAAGSACGSASSGGGTSDGGTGSSGGTAGQFIIPVKIATPDADGKIYHVVEFGQSFWAIAITYQITIADLEYWNNLSRDQKLQVGQRLFIPASGTEGYATPTPVGMVVPSTPDAEGKIIHEVQPYQTLSTIAAAYQVKIDTILALNGLQVEWPLQIGQALLISPGVVQSPLELLTPDSNGNYYHTVQSGQTLSGIARLYDLSLANLMAWNGLNADSIIVPGQKLLLIVTPPATRTSTPSPVTSQAGDTAPAATVTPTPSISSPTQTPTPIALNPTIPVTSVPQPAQFNREFLLGVVLAVGGLTVLVMLVFRKRPQSRDT